MRVWTENGSVLGSFQSAAYTRDPWTERRTTVILMPSIIFPLEIDETILDLFAKDHEALKICSLVCQAFLPTQK